MSSNAHGLRVRGTAAAVTQAFSTPLLKISKQSHTRFQARRALQVPSELAAIELRITGLDALPEHHVHARVAGRAPRPRATTATAPRALLVHDLKQAYDYPAYSASTDGSGVSVAVLMSDLIFPDDVAAMFNHEKYTARTGKPVPTVTTVTVDGGGVTDGNGSVEASLDVQQVLGGAPGAKVTLVSIPDLSDDHIMDGYQYIIDANKYDIVNSSFGGCELNYTAAYNNGIDFTYILQQYHELFQQGNAQGITFVASSGDEGGLECPSANYFNAHPSARFVAQRQHARGRPRRDRRRRRQPGHDDFHHHAGVGLRARERERRPGGAVRHLPPRLERVGRLLGRGRRRQRRFQEAGVPVPRQHRLGQVAHDPRRRHARRRLPGPGRQLRSGRQRVITAYDVDDTVNGGFFTLIGTSISSPEFVGALALFEQQLGKKNHRLGNVNNYLYAAGALQTLLGGTRRPAEFQFYHRNNPGYNGVVYDNFPSYNYNYVYGNGSPDVRKLFGLTGYKAAGVPQTPSNP